MGMGLFCHITNNKTGGNGLKLCQGTFTLDIRKTFFLERVTKHWYRLPRGFKRHIDVVVKDVLLWWTC